jgi:hypothetical protein
MVDFQQGRDDAKPSGRLETPIYVAKNKHDNFLIHTCTVGRSGRGWQSRRVKQLNHIKLNINKRQPAGPAACLTGCWGLLLAGPRLSFFFDTQARSIKHRRCRVWASTVYIHIKFKRLILASLGCAMQSKLKWRIGDRAAPTSTVYAQPTKNTIFFIWVEWHIYCSGDGRREAVGSCSRRNLYRHWR